MEGYGPPGSGLSNRSLNGELARYPLGSYLIAIDQCDAMFQGEEVHLRAVDYGDHDLVVADDLLCRCASKCEGIGPWAVDRFIVHRDEFEVALRVPMIDVILTRCCSQEEPLAACQVVFRKGMSEERALSASGFMSLVEYGDVECG